MKKEKNKKYCVKKYTKYFNNIFEYDTETNLTLDKAKDIRDLFYKEFEKEVETDNEHLFCEIKEQDNSWRVLFN